MEVWDDNSNRKQEMMRGLWQREIPEETVLETSEVVEWEVML